MKNISLAILFLGLTLSSLGFSITLNQNVANVATVNANTSITFTTSRTTLNWVILVKSKAYINMLSTANASVDDMVLYPGVYNVVRLKASQPSFKILGTGTENITLIWQDPAAGVVPVASGFDTEKVVRSYISASTTTTTTVPLSQELVVANDGTASLTVALSGPNGYSQTITLLPGNVIDEKFQPFTSFTVTTTGAFRAYTRR